MKSANEILKKNSHFIKSKKLKKKKLINKNQKCSVPQYTKRERGKESNSVCKYEIVCFVCVCVCVCRKER